MGIDSSVNDKKEQEQQEEQQQQQQQQQLPSELPKDKRKAKKNKGRNKKAMRPIVIQRLFDTCKDIFAGVGTIPSPANVERLRLVLDSMEPPDVGLSLDMPHFRTNGTEGAPPPITYLHLYENEKFSIGIFCLPPSGVIPLHNHPGMTVFSKLLFGSMHIKSYDYVDNPCSSNDAVSPAQLVQPSNARLAKIITDEVFTAPCNTSILYPAACGNMHCFTAVTACAVLDVLGPPYSDSEGRHCTYYCSFPYASFSGDAKQKFENCEEVYEWLQEREKPEDFHVVGSQYMGPKIREH